MTHRCLTCNKYPTKAEYEKCKEQKHDIDYEDLHPYEKEIEKEDNEKKQVSKILDYLKEKIQQLVLSKNDSSRVYAVSKTKNHFETIELGTERSLNWLKATFYDEKKEIYPDQPYKDAISLVKAKAQFNEDIESIIIHKRIAFHKNEIYYDLTSKNWKLVRITPFQVEVIDHSKLQPFFSRSKNQSEQIEPKIDFEKDPLDRFCKLLRIDNDLFKVHLISLFIENIPTPIMAIIGQQGSIKSTQSGLVKRVVDPSGTKLEDNLSHLPRTIDDLNIHFSHNYLTAFDNVSYINHETSDALCKAITGAGYSKRKYYTDSDEIILKFQRKIILNGITINIENGDLSERTISYFTKDIPTSERKTAEQIESEFIQLLPELLGQIFVTLHKALKLYPIVKPKMLILPRMADFAVWGEAISQALGNNKGKFLDLYRTAINQGNDLLNENNPLVPFIQEELKDKDEKILPAGSFYDGLYRYAIENHYDTKTRSFPKGSNKLRGFIERSKPLLKENGFNVDLYKNTEENNFTKNSTLIKIAKVSSPLSLPSLLDSFNKEQSESSDPSEHKREQLSEEDKT